VQNVFRNDSAVYWKMGVDPPRKPPFRGFA